MDSKFSAGLDHSKSAQYRANYSRCDLDSEEDIEGYLIEYLDHAVRMLIDGKGSNGIK